MRLDVAFGSFADIPPSLSGCPLYPLKADIAVTLPHVSVGSKGDMYGTITLHSGSPAFRRPSVNSFAFEYPPRVINADIVKAESS
jgi:hypothetical protein